MANHCNKTPQITVKKYNEEETQVPLRLPDLKIVLTATEYGYRREDGVFVIPLACLRE